MREVSGDGRGVCGGGGVGVVWFFFFNDTATTEIYTLSLHDALPISFPILLMSNCRGGMPLAFPSVPAI